MKRRPSLGTLGVYLKVGWTPCASVTRVADSLWNAAFRRRHTFSSALVCLPTLSVLHRWLCGDGQVPAGRWCFCQCLWQRAVDTAARCCHLWAHRIGAAPDPGVSIPVDWDQCTLYKCQFTPPPQVKGQPTKVNLISRCVLYFAIWSDGQC